jgi:molybdate transport system ATP-binding protein
VTPPATHALDAQVTMQLGTLHLDVDIHAAADELVVLAGPNGAGKSSLLNAVAGLAPIDTGRIALDGVVLDAPAEGVYVPPEK